MFLIAVSTFKILWMNNSAIIYGAWIKIMMGRITLPDITFDSDVFKLTITIFHKYQEYVSNSKNWKDFAVTSVQLK